MNRLNCNTNTIATGLRATWDLMRPYGRWPLVLAVGSSFTAIIDAAGIGLIFPMFVSLLHDGTASEVGGLAGGLLTQIRQSFPQYSVSGVLIGLFLSVTCLQAAMHVLIRRMTAQFQWRARHDWATSIMEDYLADDRVRLSKRQLGDQLEKMLTQTRLAATCLSQMILTVACMLNLLVLYALVCLIHWQLAAAYVLGTVVLFAATRPLWSKYAVGLGTEQIRAGRRAHSVATENLMAARDIQAFGIERERLQAFSQELDVSHRTAIKQTVVHSLSDPVGLILLSLSVILVAMTCRHGLTDQPTLMVPLVGFGLMAVRRLQTLTLNVASHTISLAGYLPSASLIRDELAQSRRSLYEFDSTNPLITPHQEPSQPVTVKNLAFAYPGNPRLFEPATFTIPQGITLLVGSSGIGKSTVADLLMGNLTCQSGEIHWGQTEITELTPSEWRQRVGYVGQDSHLFQKTVRENLLIGRRDASDEDLIQACRKARAWRFIKKLPAGLDTEVGERGLTLSMGQRQRLAIARVLVRDPPFLIFDEATNSLDSDNAILVWQAIDALRSHKTILVITHQVHAPVQPDLVLQLGDRQITVVNDGFSPEGQSVVEVPEPHTATVRRSPTAMQSSNRFHRPKSIEQQ